MMTASVKGCQNREEAALPQSFPPKEILMEYKGNKFSGTAQKEGELLILSLSSDDLAKEIVIEQNKDFFTFSSDGFTFTSKNKAAPSFLLFEAFERLKEGETLKLPDGTKLINEPFEALFSSKDAVLKEILFPLGKVSFSLSQHH